MALGNILGSNIANICLIMGLCAIVRSLPVSRQTWRHELMILVATTLMFAGLSWDLTLSRLDGAVLLLGMSAFTVYCLYAARRHASDEPELAEGLQVMTRKESLEGSTVLGYSGLIVVSLLMLVGGADLLVGGAKPIAKALGISSTLVGLTVVAIGTSLPELATSFAAVRRKETDIVVGNVLGSNIMNILLVMGLVAMLFPIAVPADTLWRDYLSGVLLTLLLLPFLYTGRRLRRREGGVLLVLYVGYITWAWQTGALPI